MPSRDCKGAVAEPAFPSLTVRAGMSSIFLGALLMFARRVCAALQVSVKRAAVPT
jgi:hypothetical protein